MSEAEKLEFLKFKRQLLLTIIAIGVPFILSSIGILIRMHEDTAILKSYKETYFDEVNSLVDQKMEYMDAYVFRNDADKEEIKRKIERIEDQLIQLRMEKYPVRGKAESENIFKSGNGG